MFKDLLIDIVPFIVFAFHLIDKWYLSKGRLWQVYILAILSSLSSILFTYLLYNALDGQHKSVLLFSLNSAWTIAMSVKGITRLIKAHKKKSEIGQENFCNLPMKVASYGKK